ncbi:unnamed protein product [Blepharisma stoltei]|uniref:Uncharacterized protein n=1 Tax=Blepharisma stoltei TaxID=1481888 RepID=A0AAU9K7P4_9CILI|nr:unnamed protein product [Blepharisma stoltei]
MYEKIIILSCECKLWRKWLQINKMSNPKIQQAINFVNKMTPDTSIEKKLEFLKKKLSASELEEVKKIIMKDDISKYFEPASIKEQKEAGKSNIKYFILTASSIISGIFAAVVTTNYKDIIKRNKDPELEEDKEEDFMVEIDIDKRNYIEKLIKSQNEGFKKLSGQLNDINMSLNSMNVRKNSLKPGLDLD